MLVAWMSDNNTKTWSEVLCFIQSKKNRALHSGIKTSPYEAVWNGAEDLSNVTTRCVVLKQPQSESSRCGCFSNARTRCGRFFCPLSVFDL
jgi:hypothetical protein